MTKDQNQLERLYNEMLGRKGAMALHMPRLRNLAIGKTVVEFGVNAAFSTVAFLASASKVYSFDKNVPRRAGEIQAAAGDAWEFTQADTREIEIPECDLLLVDSEHTYAVVDAELKRHARKVREFLVFHDTITFGSIGADKETGALSWAQVPSVSVPREHLGIRPAIDELMMRDRSWRIEAHYTDSHGLLVLWKWGQQGIR